MACLWPSAWAALPRAAFASENEFATTAMPLFAQYCFDCHSDDAAEAQINLQQLASTRSFAASFKDWRRVEAMLQTGKMPPEEMPQPTAEERRRLVALVQGELSRAADEEAGDPGDVVMRRLTSAEYAYTIADLTGVDLDLGADFVDDAVGGEGFANIGIAQFMQDSTLERYLEAARHVADHAVVGAGPLMFYRDPGKTGLELSAINRIQAIYHAHGFRTAAGEGGKPYGLDAYPKAFFAAWRYKYQSRTGFQPVQESAAKDKDSHGGLDNQTPLTDELATRPTLSLEDIAADEGLAPRFALHIWSVLSQPSPSFPMSEIVSAWNELPAPEGPDQQLEQDVRDQCDNLYKTLRTWQRRLARAAGHNEEASILAAGSFEVPDEKLRDRRSDWPDDMPLEARRAGVLELANLLPQVSHREPAPSDRDPIPPPFDNAYNKPERDHFHYRVKYHRDDRFLVEHMLDDATRVQLDQAWTDLFMSFEYHDTFLRFVAEKYKLDFEGRTVAGLDADWIDVLPEAPRQYVRALHDEHASMARALAAAQARHVSDAVEFASRAWRRPLTEDEKARLADYYMRLRQGARLDHVPAVRALLTRILVAPDFLYRVERPHGEDDGEALSDWELASRLSYFLWSSPPDEELCALAAAGTLREPSALTREARRMLADKKARRLATEFFGQWFGFYRFDSYRGIDPERFPEFTPELRAAMYDEAIAFFEHIVRNDRPVSEILFADYAFLSDELARHYVVELEEASESASRGEDSLRGQVGNLSYYEGVGEFHRGGLLGLGAVLTVTSAPLRTSPVKRGDWVLRRVLGTPVPPPPPDAGSIAADDVQGDGRTVRERLEAHRRDASCVNCHSRMDPLGFALEHYDPLGRWRETYRDGQAIDASGTLSDGTLVSGPEGLREYLKRQEKLFQRTLCTKLIGYALGRSEMASDAQLTEQMMSDLEGGGRFSDLVVRIVTSRQFDYSRPCSPNAASE